MLAVTGPLFFNGTCYTTYQYEVNPSVTTNVHMIGAWPENDKNAKILDWLSTEMDDRGAVTCKWHVSYLYATAELLRLFARLEIPSARELARRAALCLLDSQHSDGGWGERCNTYDDPVFKGQGPSTASQTAWAVMGLCAFDDPHRPSLVRGIEYLIRTQNEDGSWTEHETTGTGFPKVFYLKYDMYRNAWPLLALATHRNVLQQAVTKARGRVAHGAPVELVDEDVLVRR